MRPLAQLSLCKGVGNEMWIPWDEARLGFKQRGILMRGDVILNRESRA